MFEVILENLILISGVFSTGSLICRLLAPGTPQRLKGFLGLTSGILFYYLSWIVFPFLQPVRWAATGAGIAGILFQIRNRDLLKTLFFSALLLPLLFKNPVSGWDADSIWYFHAKMIHWDREFPFFESLSRPGAGFSHPAYPKLFPLFSALSASGHPWNDHSPKLGFVFFYTPLLLLLSNLDLRIPVRIGIFIVSFLGMKYFPFASLPEHPMALWCAAGTALLFVFEDEPAAGWLALGIAAGIKAEGVIFLGSALAIAALSRFLKTAPSRIPLSRGSRILTIALCLLPTPLWLGLARLRMTTPLSEGFLSSLPERIGGRISNPGVFFSISRSFFQADQFFWELFLASLVLFKPIRRPALVLLGYFAGLYLVYLTTPYDLGWHLVTSIDRTVLPGVASAYLLIYLNLFRGKPAS